jgi:hypothetical protein
MAEVCVSTYLGIEKTPLWKADELIPDSLVQIAQESMSEFDVLEMAQQDAHYAGGSMTPLLANHVKAPPFVQVSVDKTWAPNVTGNIGEGVGIATLLHLGGVGPEQVARIKRQKERMPSEAKRTPDFIAFTPARNAAEAIRAVLTRHVAKSVKRTITTVSSTMRFPDRFPIETKGTMKGSGPSLWSGIWQLLEYWHSCIGTPIAEAEVGHGVLICTTDIGTPSRCVLIRIFIPRNQSLLRNQLVRLVDTRGSQQAYERQFAPFQEDAFVSLTDLVR